MLVCPHQDLCRLVSRRRFPAGSTGPGGGLSTGPGGGLSTGPGGGLSTGPGNNWRRVRVPPGY